MVRRAIETQVNGEGNRSPGWILCATVKTYLFGICQLMGDISQTFAQRYLIGSLCLEFRKQSRRLGLGGSGSHVGESTNMWLSGVWGVCGD